MKRSARIPVVVAAMGITLSGTVGFSQSRPPTQGPASDGSPGWFLQGSYPDPGGRTIVEPGGKVTIPARDNTPPTPAGAARGAVPPPTPGCRNSPLCGSRFGPGSSGVAACPVAADAGLYVHLPIQPASGFGGVPAVALDSTGNLWVFQRAPIGKPQLFKFDANHKLVLEVGDGRDRLSGQSAWHGCRCGRQRLDHGRQRRHRNEGQCRRQTADDDRREGTAAATGTKRAASGCSGSR
jgi:hypothetical protein